jgi:hypothetical protein
LSALNLTFWLLLVSDQKTEISDQLAMLRPPNSRTRTQLTPPSRARRSLTASRPSSCPYIVGLDVRQGPATSWCSTTCIRIHGIQDRPWSHAAVDQHGTCVQRAVCCPPPAFKPGTCRRYTTMARKRFFPPCSDRRLRPHPILHGPLGCGVFLCPSEPMGLSQKVRPSLSDQQHS